MKDSKDALKDLAGTIKNPVTFFVVAVLGMSWAVTAVAPRLSPRVAACVAVLLVVAIGLCCWFVARMTREQPEHLVREFDARSYEVEAISIGRIARDIVLQEMDRQGLLSARMDGAEPPTEESADAG